MGMEIPNKNESIRPTVWYFLIENVVKEVSDSEVT